MKLCIIETGNSWLCDNMDLLSPISKTGTSYLLSDGDVYDDFIIYIKDITNKDYVFVSENCEVEGRICTDYSGR